MEYIKLFENYQSQKDLEYLSKAILKMVAEKTLNKLHHNQQRIYELETVYFKSLNPNAFGSLADFIKNFNNLEIYFISREEFLRHAKGSAVYLSVSGDDGGNLQRLILMIEDRFTMKRINDDVTEWDYDNTEDVVRDITTSLVAHYNGHLLHELQHAYDDWRSGGKFITQQQDSGDKEKFNELSDKDMTELKEEELDFIDKFHIEYLNLRHEVDARFTDAIAKTRFYMLDLDLSIEHNKDVLTMKPYKEVLDDFKGNIYPYIHLTDEHKRRVLRKFGQIYELEKEFVKQKNSESEKYD
jgi:hypothetical protein